jgi:hypothetical protein
MVTWARLLELLLTFLNFIGLQIEKKQVEKERSDAQEERNKIEDNPVDWLNEHFNGVRGEKGKEESSTNKAGN